MQTGQGTMLQTLHTVQQFLDKYAERLGAMVKSGSRRQLDQVVADLSRLAGSQASSANAGKGGTQKAKELRTVLVLKHMLPIARIAAVDIPVTPELASKLRMPKGNPTAAKLVGFARGMATSAEPFAATFIAAGLPLDFLAQLNGAADAVADYEAHRKSNKGVGQAATSGIKRMLSTGTRVLTAVDSLVRKELEAGVPTDALILTEWTSVKKTRKTPTRPVTLPAPVPIPPEDAETSTDGAS